MKKLILATFTLLSFASQAQFINNVGIKSGVSIANQDWENKYIYLDFENEYRTGLYLGVTYEMLKKEYFSLMADFGYVQKGTKFDLELTSENQPEGTGEFITVDNRYDFFVFQPLAKFRFPFKHVQPYVFAGPRFDFYISYTSDYEPMVEFEGLEALTYGGSYGIGLDYSFSNCIISLEGQHQPDFKELRKPITLYPGYGLSIKNTAFLVTLAVKYMLH